MLGEEVREAVLVEVTCSVKQLRSRACLVLLNTDSGHAYLWRGSQALSHTHQVSTSAQGIVVCRRLSVLCLNVKISLV